MKYKVGDKVKLKVLDSYCMEAVRDIKKINGIGTIREISENTYYYMEEIGWNWTDKQVEEYKEPVYEPINSRFEILDL